MTVPSLLVYLALLFLWCRVWTDGDRAFFFNPFVSGPMRVVDRVLGWLRVPLPFLPGRALAGIALLAALALKAVATPGHGALQGRLALRVEIQSFAAFAFQVAAVNAVLRLMSPRRMDRAARAADLLSRPVAWIPRPAWQLSAAVAALLVLGALPFLPAPAGMFPAGNTAAGTPVFLKAALFSGLRNAVDILRVWSQCALLAVVASWLGLLMPRNGAAACARDFTSLLLGRFAGLLVVGMVDVTPLVFFLAADHAHAWLLRLAASLLE